MRLDMPTKCFVSPEVFHAIVSDTDLGPDPVVDTSLDDTPVSEDEPRECFDTIEHMLEGGAFADEVDPVFEGPSLANRQA